MIFDTIYYHADCVDGFVAATLLAQGNWGDGALRMIPSTYGVTEPKPAEYDGQVVAVVDFSFPLEQMHAIAKGAARLVVLDHHESAKATLREIERNYPQHTVVYGENHARESGAFLAWRFIGCPRRSERLVELVARRDTWDFGDDEFAANNMTAGISFLVQNLGPVVTARVVWGGDIEGYIASRGLIVRQVEAVQRQQLVKMAYYDASDNTVYCNSPVQASDLGADLLEAYPEAHFAYIWYRNGDRTKVSLRSRPGSEHDCAAEAEYLARIYEGVGGGHKHAAGFTFVTD